MFGLVVDEKTVNAFTLILAVVGCGKFLKSEWSSRMCSCQLYMLNNFSIVTRDRTKLFMESSMSELE